MSMLNNEELAAKQKIAKLNLAINREKTKLDKTLTRQKIILGAFFLDLLEKNQVQGLRQHTAQTLPKYLSKDTDRELFKGLIKNCNTPARQQNPVNPVNPDRQQYQDVPFNQ